MDWNKRFFGKSYDPEEEREEGYDEARAIEEYGRRANLAGYQQGNQDGYEAGLRAGHTIGVLEGRKKEIRNSIIAYSAGFLVSLYCCFLAIKLDKLEKERKK